MKEYNFIALMCKHLIGIISHRLQFGPTCIDCKTLNCRSQTKATLGILAKRIHLHMKSYSNLDLFPSSPDLTCNQLTR